MRWKSKFYVKELDRVFTNGSLLDVHISRVAVLYEDLRLEMMAASEVSLPTLDTIGMEHRRIYFARRSIGTLRELAEAIRLLDELPEFQPVRDGFDKTSAAVWTKAVRFFRRREPYIERIRDDFGGHFGLPPALHAVSHLNDTPVALEFTRDPLTDRGGPKLKFVTEITAIAMRRHHLAGESRLHFRRLFILANLGFNHAVRSAHVLTTHYLLDRFRA